MSSRKRSKKSPHTMTDEEIIRAYTLFAIAGLLVFANLIATTQTAFIGPRLNEAKAANSKVRSEYQDLAVKAGQLQSLQATRSSEVSKEMVQVQSPIYVKP